MQTKIIFLLSKANKKSIFWHQIKYLLKLIIGALDVTHHEVFLFCFLKWFILGRTGLTWTYRRPYARTRWHLWDSNP